MTRGDIRTAIKTMIGRNFSGIDAVLNEYINTTVELFSSIVSSVYDEQEWEHTITQADVNNKVESYELPANSKQLLDVFYIDVSGTERLYYPITIISPIELDETSRKGIVGSFTMSEGGLYDYTSAHVTLPRQVYGDFGRVDFAGIPRVCARKGNRLFVYPRPGTREVGNKIRIFIGTRPSLLTADTGEGSTNTITDKYPRALMLYTIAMFWSLYLRDLQTGQQWLQHAVNALQAFARADEIAKLSNAVIHIGR